MSASPIHFADIVHLVSVSIIIGFYLSDACIQSADWP